MGVETPIIAEAPQIALARFRINGATPFGPTPLDSAEALLEQAQAIATVASQALSDMGRDTDLSLVHPKTLAASMQAVTSLIALASFMLEGRA